MNVEEVCSLKVVRRKLRHRISQALSSAILMYLSKVDLVKHDLVRMANAIKSRYYREYYDDDEGDSIVPLRRSFRLELLAQFLDRVFDFNCGGINSVLFRAVFRSAMAERARGRRS